MPRFLGAFRCSSREECPEEAGHGRPKARATEEALMLTAVPIEWFLLLSAVLFALGVAGFLFRRNIITVFMSIELMLNAVNLSFVTFSYHHKQVAGHLF